MSSTKRIVYWREDPLLNEHHEHWHLVYPYQGIVDTFLHSVSELVDIEAGNAKAKYLKWNSRHGEIFAYMHSQMLARYSAELICSNLPQVVPFDDYRSVITEGYDPGTNFFFKADGSRIPVSPRPDNIKLSDITAPSFANRPGANISSQEIFRDRLIAVAKASLQSRNISYSNFAEAVEATLRFETTYFGALHNDGHIMLSLQNTDESAPNTLFWEATSIRDPLFYRWHSHIDFIFRTFQSQLPAHDFLDLPKVFAESITLRPHPSGAVNEIWTELRNGRVSLPDASQKDFKYISHSGFEYEILLSNFNAQEISITVRIFICPESMIEHYSSWIEMDKFNDLLSPSSLTTISRQSSQSSVVRHPIIDRDALDQRVPWPTAGAQAAGCKCGWPYTLLMPSGGAYGENFRLMIIVTNGDDITSSAGGSLQGSSYCGVTGEDYPDKRPMGYPFDRPFSKTIKSWLDDPHHKIQQVASTRIKIWQS